ncbi:MAG: Hsp33 family molecular chaperone HslO [Christensenellaceae bacterium]|jgi:molecular chaperone Hsp33
MKDSVYRYLLNGEVVVTAASTKEIANTARELHETFPVSTAVLGRTLTAAVLMASMFKESNDTLTISLNGGGPAGTVLATANGACEVKGYMDNPHVDLPAKENGQLDVGGAVGTEGFLTVVRDTGVGEPYIGRTPLVSGEVAEDLAMYFLQSEQQPTIVYINTWVDIDLTVLTAGGLIISPLPGATEETLSYIESCVPEIQSYGMRLMQMTPDEAVRAIFPAATLKPIEMLAPAYVCDCSEARFERGIIALGEEEIKSMIDEDGEAEVICRFCNKRYLFDRKKLQKLLEEASK